MRLVVGIDDEVATTGLVVGRGEPLHHEVYDLRAKVQTPVLGIYAKLGKEDGGIVDESLLMMHLTANLLLAGIRQTLGENAGIGHGETGHDVGRTIGQTEIIGLAEEFILVFLSLVVEEIIDSLPTAVESLDVQP